MPDDRNAAIEEAVPLKSSAGSASANPPPPAAVKAKGLFKTFDADVAPVRALRGADLTVGRGEYVALVGPSGSGKSTLLHLLAGLDRPDSGSVFLNHTDLGELGEDDLARIRRQHIGFVFQFFQLIDSMSALDNVALASLAAGARPAAARRRARDLLDLLGLLDKSGTVPRMLSGGQRQRLAIARALANSPTILLADEPTGSLDTAGAAEIQQLFQRLAAHGQTILLVTHSAEVAAGADRQVRMRDGRIDSDFDQPDRRGSGIVDAVS